jgi:hypothetical protein
MILPPTEEETRVASQLTYEEGTRAELFRRRKRQNCLNAFWVVAIEWEEQREHGVKNFN